MEKSQILNMIQDQQFKNIISTRPKDIKVQQLSRKYYSEFKKHQSSIQADKIELYLKCAYYLAEKSQWMTDLNGQKIRNAGLSLNQLLKKHLLQDVMITLKQFSKRITIEDPQTLDDLQKLIKQISFLITFYSKFQKVLLKLQMKQKNLPYSQTLSEFVWLLYIQAKNKLLCRSLQLIDNTCMLAHALCFVLVYSWQFHQPGYFTKGQNNLLKLTSRKQVNARIHEKILQFFLIKNVEYYKNMAERFQSYFLYLKKSNVIKMADKDHFLSPDIIQGNYKRLDYYYQKRLDFNYLDQRIFFKDRSSNLTPNKFTPFARQKIHIPNKKIGGNLSGLSDRTVQQRDYFSHKILNYDAMQTQITQTSLFDVPLAEIKMPKNIMQTPINNTTPLIQQTPYTTGIMMYNYVTDLSTRLHKKKFSSRQVDQVIFQTIDDILKEAITNNEHSRSMQIKRNQIFSVYKLVAEQFGALYPNEVQSEQIMKSILLVAIQIVFFVSNIDVSFDKLQAKFNLSHISIWRAIDYFLKFDKAMPANIKVHLLDVQVQIISQKIWKDSQNIANIQMFLQNNKLSSKQTQILYEKLCKRILHQIAFQIMQLCKNLFEPKQIQNIPQIAFDIMKQVLLNHPYMILYNHFDQIIMCTLFSICRAKKLNVKFQNIKQTYLLCNAHLSQQKKHDIFTNIEYQYHSQQPQKNTGIIGFYNSCFLIEMNMFVKNICNNYASNNSSRPSTQRALQSKDVNILLQSPITGIIPKDINYGLSNMNTTSTNTGKMGQRKNTPLLHAYTQSPLLKNDMVPIKNPIHSRKAINFEETQKMLTNNTTIPTTKKDPMNDTCKLYQENSQTSNFFNKKFVTKPTKMGPQTPSIVKSPCNGTISPSNRQSPSPRIINDPMLKQNNNYQNIYYTKREYPNKNGLNLNIK